MTTQNKDSEVREVWKSSQFLSDLKETGLSGTDFGFNSRIKVIEILVAEDLHVAAWDLKMLLLSQNAHEILSF